MSLDRFRRLRTGASGAGPGKKASSPAESRFLHLEIGNVRPREKKTGPSSDRVACPSCGQLNEIGRDLCWACFQSVKATTGSKREAPLEVLLNGTLYRSDQTNLPHDIRVLMKMLHTKGHTPNVIAQWKAWRASRGS